MFKYFHRISLSSNRFLLLKQKRNFLTNEYQCSDAWNTKTSPILDKINMNDFYNVLDQNYSSKGVISAIDVDIFAKSIKDGVHLEELRDLLHKLRLSAETGHTLDSTHHATIRNFLRFGKSQELIDILKDPLNYGVFLDNYSANILLDKLLKEQEYELAANVGSLVMLQEEYDNDITRCLSQYACYKYICAYIPPEPITAPAVPEKKKKVEEIKIRVKFLRNPYFDDHFDIKDTITLSGKTLAWMSDQPDNLNLNLKIVGWLTYKKYDELLSTCQNLSKAPFKVYTEVIELLQKASNDAEADAKTSLEKCLACLANTERIEDATIEKSLKIAIENAINKSQNKDVSMQKELFKSWEKIREIKLEEQTQRLSRARRIELIKEKQKELQTEEQKLWFFNNKEQIELEIESKEKPKSDSETKNSVSKDIDENYIPPEILPKRK